MKLSELAALTGARLEATDNDIEITGAAGLDEAGEGDVTFLANPRYTPRVNTTRARAKKRISCSNSNQRGAVSWLRARKVQPVRASAEVEVNTRAWGISWYFPEPASRRPQTG